MTARRQRARPDALENTRPAGSAPFALNRTERLRATVSDATNSAWRASRPQNTTKPLFPLTASHKDLASTPLIPAAVFMTPLARLIIKSCTMSRKTFIDLFHMPLSTFITGHLIAKLETFFYHKSLFVWYSHKVIEKLLVNNFLIENSSSESIYFLHEKCMIIISRVKSVKF